jgi:hypothetical protein
LRRPIISAPVASRARETESRAPFVFNRLLQHYRHSADISPMGHNVCW